MSEESGTANETATADLSGGFNNLKETVYNFLGNFFSWLSTHQGLALVILLIVLGIVVWLIRILITVISNNNTVISTHTEVSNGILKAQERSNDENMSLREELMKRPCMARRN